MLNPIVDLKKFKNTQAEKDRAIPMEKIARAVIFYMQNNPIERGDAHAIAEALRTKGYLTEEIYLKNFKSREAADAFPIEDYNAVIFLPILNGHFCSGKSNRAVLESLLSRSKENSLYLFGCDVTMLMKPQIADCGETSAEKKNPFLDYPFHVVGSFSEDLLSDTDAVDRIHFIWSRCFAPESTFSCIEWNTFHYWTVEKEFAEKEKLSQEKGIESKEDISGFYYGFHKAKIARSLKSMGVEEDPRSAVFGGIGKSLKNVRNLCNEKEKLSYLEEKWIPHARASEYLYFPYEPIKGDYQITKRVMEYRYFTQGDLEKVKFDPRVSSHIRFALEDNHLSKIATQASENLEKLLKGNS